MMKLYAPFISGRAGAGLLIFRIVTGLALMMHGFSKIQHPFSWMDAMNSGVPPFLQACAAVAEFGGGLAIVLGFLTPLACLGVFATMATAILMVHLPQGGQWVGGPNAYESAASYLVASVMLFLTGPGTISIDKFLFGGNTQFVETPYVAETEKLGSGI